MVKPREVREAREFLRRRGVRAIAPLLWAQAAQEMGMSYRELFSLMAGLAGRVRDDRLRK